MVRYVIQRYRRYAIYEPAEGGYFYEGCEPDEHPWAIFDTQQEAIDELKKIVDEANEELSREDEGFLVIGLNEKTASSINHRYIGDGFEFFVEPINRRGRARKGPVPYC